MLNRRFLCLAAVVVSLAGCATSPTPLTLADQLAQTPSLSTLHGLVLKAGLNDTLKGPGPFTVFAPNNEAFKAVPAKTMDELAKDPARLQAVLKYHLLPAQLTAANVKNGPAKTLEGANLTLARTGAFITVEEAMVVTADIQATNGTVHILDRVLVPPVRK